VSGGPKPAAFYLPIKFARASASAGSLGHRMGASGDVQSPTVGAKYFFVLVFILQSGGEKRLNELLQMAIHDAYAPGVRFWAGKSF